MFESLSKKSWETKALAEFAWTKIIYAYSYMRGKLQGT